MEQNLKILFKVYKKEKSERRDLEVRGQEIKIKET
jgi:hypothetical protein